MTFLPLLDEPCTFDLLVYTDTDSVVPSEWCAGGPARSRPAHLPARSRAFPLLTAGRRRRRRRNTCREESDPRMVANSAEVKLRSFSTKVHKARGGGAPGPAAGRDCKTVPARR